MKQKLQALRNLASENALRAGVAVVSLVPALSMAQSTDPFDTALASATTKVTGYAGALVTFAAVAVVFMVAIKYVKKIPRAS